MAMLANVPVENARLFLYDDGPRVFVEFYGKTKLPKELRNAFHVALRTMQDAKTAGEENWREIYTRNIVGRLVDAYHEVCPENLEQVLSQISRQVIERPGE